MSSTKTTCWRISLTTLALIFLLAAYTRFINKLNEATASSDAERGSDWSRKEVWAWQALVLIACFLVLFVFVFALASAIVEIYWGEEGFGVYDKDPHEGDETINVSDGDGDVAKLSLPELQRSNLDMAQRIQQLERTLSDAGLTVPSRQGESATDQIGESAGGADNKVWA